MDQGAQEIEAAPFTPAEAANASPLHVARKEKPLHHLGGLHAAAVARLDQRRFLLDELDQTLRVVQFARLLVVVTEPHRFTPVYLPRVDLDFIGQHVEKGTLTGAVRAEEADAIARLERKVNPVYCGCTGVEFCQTFRCEDGLAQPAGGQGHHHTIGVGIVVNALEFGGALFARLLLGAPGHRRPPDPIQFPLEELLALPLLRGQAFVAQ